MATAINTETYDDDLMIVKATLTSDGSGDASASTTGSYSGRMVQFTVDNDDSDTPTANWDLTIKDDYETEVTNGLGTNLSAATTLQTFSPQDLEQGMMLTGNLDFVGANMGSAKTAVIVCYIERIR